MIYGSCAVGRACVSCTAGRMCSKAGAGAQTGCSHMHGCRATRSERFGITHVDFSPPSLERADRQTQWHVPFLVPFQIKSLNIGHLVSVLQQYNRMHALQSSACGKACCGRQKLDQLLYCSSVATRMCGLHCRAGRVARHAAVQEGRVSRMMAALHECCEGCPFRGPCLPAFLALIDSAACRHPGPCVGCSSAWVLPIGSKSLMFLRSTRIVLLLLHHCHTGFLPARGRHCDRGLSSTSPAHP